MASEAQRTATRKRRAYAQAERARRSAAKRTRVVEPYRRERRDWSAT